MKHGNIYTGFPRIILIKDLFNMMVRFHGLIITPSIDGSCNAARKSCQFLAVKVDMILSLPLSSFVKAGECSQPLFTIVSPDSLKIDPAITFGTLYSNNQLFIFPSYCDGL